MFDKIITITINPSLDATLWVDKFDLEEPVNAIREQFYPGGKSINVSRVLTSLGINNTSVGIIGADNAEKLNGLLKKENVKSDFILSQGSTRENLSIVLPDGKLFKINRSGLEVSLETVEKFKKKLHNMIVDSKKVLLVFAGSLPKGITKEIYKNLVLFFKRENTSICIDTDIFSKEDLIEISPFIIKPNNIELSHIAKKELENLDEIKKQARELSKYVKHVLVSVGKDGLLYADENQVIHAKSPNVEVKSTVGAGDTTLAGFIVGLSSHKSLMESVIFATACGTASVCLEGTAIIKKEQAEKMVNLIEIE